MPISPTAPAAPATRTVATTTTRFTQMRLLVCALTVVTLALFGASADAIDLVNLTSVGGPLAGVFTILGGLTPGLKALVAFVGFLVAAIALIAARNFAPVLYYVGVIIFLAVALVVAGSILGATL